MNIRLSAAIAFSMLVASSEIHAYELATHALITYRAYTRSELFDPEGPVQQRLGLDRLDPSGPFTTATPYSFGPHYYHDNQASNPPTLPPPAQYERDIQPFEREEAFTLLLARGFITAPPPGPYFGSGDSPEVRFENSLPAWLMRGAIREDDFGIPLKGPMGASEGAPRDPDPSGEFLRVSSHFYDPVHNIPLTVLGIQQGSKATDWALGLTNALDVSEPEDTGRRQHFSLRDFYNNLYWAMTLERPHVGGGPRTARDRERDSDERKQRFATSLKSLGHVVHLLQDMAQPQHSRNDQHLGISAFIKKRLFEPFTETRVTQNFGNGNYTGVVTDFFGYPPPHDWFPQPVFAGASGDYPIPAFTHAVQYYTTRGPTDNNSTIPSRKGLADFSNKNFFTVGTMPGDTDFPYPSQTLSGYAQVQIGDAMVIGNEHTTNFYLTAPVQDALNPSFRDQLPSYTNGQVPLLSLSQLQDLSDLTPAATNEVSLDLTNYVAMADVNIPRAIGYSAGMMNFAFRGELEVAAPADRVVAVLNQGATHTMNAQGYPCTGTGAADGCPIFGFEKVRVRIRNTTPVITDPTTGTPIAQGTGSLNNTASIVAVARYHRNSCYKPDLSGERVQSYVTVPTTGITEPTCSAGQTVRTDYQEISVSAPLNVSAGELDNLPDGGGIDKLFDFAADPIPANATDLFIQVVYRGPLGSEASSVAVGNFDVREPTFAAFWNNTDYWWNGTSWFSHTTTYPNEGAKDFWACAGGAPVKLVFFYQGANGSPAMVDPIAGSNHAGMVRLGFIFPPPDPGIPAQRKSIRGVPVNYAIAGTPQIPQQSVSTPAVFRQANKEHIAAGTLAAPYNSCASGLPTVSEYWCFDAVQKRRNQIMGAPMQPLYLQPIGTGTIPPDVDAAPAQPAFAGVVPLATGTIRFNTDATLANCPAQPTSAAQPAVDTDAVRYMELQEEARDIGIDDEQE